MPPLRTLTSTSSVSCANACNIPWDVCLPELRDGLRLDSCTFRVSIGEFDEQHSWLGVFVLSFVRL
jgi:hypothetical protein